MDENVFTISFWLLAESMQWSSMVNQMESKQALSSYTNGRLITNSTQVCRFTLAILNLSMMVVHRKFTGWIILNIFAQRLEKSSTG